MTPPSSVESGEKPYSYQFDPLDSSGRVEVTLNGVPIAEVQSIKSAETMCANLNACAGLNPAAIQPLIAALEAADKAGLFDRLTSINSAIPEKHRVAIRTFLQALKTP